MSEILGEILNASDESSINKRLEACFHAYDELRRPRTKEVTRTSRKMGDIIEYREKDIGRDLTKMKANLDVRMNWIWDVDLMGEVEKGIEMARRALELDDAGGGQEKSRL